LSRDIYKKFFMLLILPFADRNLIYCVSFLSIFLKDVFVVNHENVDIRYFEMNSSSKVKDKGTVLFVHGIPSSSWIFYESLLKLSKKGYHVIALDFPGFGQSKVPVGFGYSIKEYSDLLTAFIESKKIEKFNYVVHDFGGPFAWLTLDNPVVKKGLQNIFVLNTIGTVNGFNPPASKLPSFVGNIAAYLASQLMGGSFFQRETEVKLSRKSLKDYAAPLKSDGRKTYRKLIKKVVTGKMKKQIPVFNKKMSEFEGGVYIFWGLDDSILNGELQIPELRQLFKNVKSEACFPKAKHFVSIDRPSDLGEFIDLSLKGKSTLISSCTFK